MKRFASSSYVSVFAISNTGSELRFTQDDVEVFEQVFLENNKETLHDKVWLGAVISFYNDFVMHAEVETARGEAGGGHSLSDRMMYNSQNK